MKASKLIGLALVTIMMLQSFSVLAAEHVKAGDTKKFDNDAYILTPAEAKKAADNAASVKNLEEQVKQYESLVAKLEQESALKDRQLQLTEQELETYKQMYASAQTAYEKERDKDSKFYNQPLFWFSVGVLVTVGAAGAGYAATK